MVPSNNPDEPVTAATIAAPFTHDTIDILRGVSFRLVGMTVNQEMTGVMFAAILNYAEADRDGFQAAAIFNKSANTLGVQTSLMN